MKIGDRIFVRGYIDEIRKDTVIVRNDGGYFGTIPSEVTGELPSAQPERKTGHWIKTARWGRVYYCDQCRNYLDFDGVNVGRGSTNFCPNCGAKMDEEGKDD